MTLTTPILTTPTSISLRVRKAVQPSKTLKDLAIWLCSVALLAPTTALLSPAFAAPTVATTTTLSTGATSVAVGTPVLLTARVTGTAPTGTVTFKRGTTTLGTGTLAGTGNTRTATYSATFTTVASNSLTAVYGADAVNKTSTSTAKTVTSTKATPSNTLASSLNPSTSGASVTFTATVKGYNPSGTVTFKDGTTTLGTGTLAGAGNTRSATYTKANLTVAAHSITAVYAGDTLNNTKTSAALSQVVGAAKTTATATVSSSLNPSTSGASVTFTASVTGTAPTGTVTFKNGTTTLGTGTLAGTGNTRSASFATPSLSVASHPITVVYGGDTGNTTATSSALSQVVNAGVATTTTTLTSNPASAGLGTPITFSATVTGNTPSGVVTFKNGTTTLGTGAVTAGVATFSTSALAIGTHSLTAVYAGDTKNATSTSGVLNQTITAALVSTPMTWQYGYDAMGRPTINTDPYGKTAYTYYDKLGRPIQTQQAVGGQQAIVTLEYNAADSLTKVIDPRNLPTTYNPTGLGTVVSQSSPDTGGASATFDANRNLLTKTDARGKTTTYSYDNLNRLTKLDYATGTDTTLEYDGGATPTPAAAGELTKVTDESGQTSFTYDSAGRLSTKTQVTNGKTFTVTYTWGNSGSSLDKLTAITYPSGNRVNYAYDATGTVSGITVNKVNANGVGFSATASALLSAITLTPAGEVSGWIWASGKTQSWTYDQYGQPKTYKLGDPTGAGISAGSIRTIGYDGAGRIMAYSHTNNAAPLSSLNQSFAYDDLTRLVSANMGSSSIQYSYDLTGNRTAKVISGKAYNNTVSPSSNKLTQTQDAIGGTATVQYDAMGNVTNDGVNTYTYSDRGRLSSVTTAGGTVSYRYNGFEQRTYKTGPAAIIPTGAAYYVYDESGKLLGEYDANGAPIYETIYLNTSPVNVLKQTGTAQSANIATNTFNVYSDHLATPRVITRATDEAIVWRWDAAEAFGATAPDQNPNNLGTFTYNQRLPGQVFDQETGLFQNWHREYNARLGRYMQSDPIGLRGGINTYAYVEGNPLSYTDPTGEFVPQLIGFGIGAGLEYLTNPCASAADLLLAGGLGALGGGLSKAAFLRLGPRSLTRETGLEWSHSIARRTVNRHTSGGLNRALNQRGGLNGSWRTPASHARHDASRHVAGVDPMPLPLRALDRIPDWLKGTALGGGVGATVAGGDCECR